MHNKKMPPLLKTATIRMPDAVFVRMGGAQCKEDAMGYCERCGVIDPKQYANGYLPGQCACQVAEHERLEVQKIRRESWGIRQQSLLKQCQKCYTWLGPQWSNPSLSKNTFDMFDTSMQPEAFIKTFSFSKLLQGNLILYSLINGTGKTHLATALCNALIARNTPCLFAMAQDMFHAFNARFENGEGVSDFIEQASSTPLFVVDDLSQINSTTYKESLFISIINQRYLQNLPTVFTTNANIEVTSTDIIGLSPYIGKAACSRLKQAGLQTINMDGIDYRHEIWKRSQK